MLENELIHSAKNDACKLRRSVKDGKYLALLATLKYDNDDIAPISKNQIEELNERDAPWSSMVVKSDEPLGMIRYSDICAQVKGLFSVKYYRLQLIYGWLSPWGAKKNILNHTLRYEQNNIIFNPQIRISSKGVHLLCWELVLTQPKGN